MIVKNAIMEKKKIVDVEQIKYLLDNYKSVYLVSHNFIKLENEKIKEM